MCLLIVVVMMMSNELSVSHFAVTIYCRVQLSIVLAFIRQCFGMVSCRLNGLVLSHTSVFRQYLVLDAECMTDNQCLSDFFYRLISS